MLSDKNGRIDYSKKRVIQLGIMKLKKGRETLFLSPFTKIDSNWMKFPIVKSNIYSEKENILLRKKFQK